MFAIHFSETPVPLDRLGEGERADYAQIQIDDFTEDIIVPTSYWSKNEYVKQWINSIELLLTESCNKTGLITEMYDPKSEKYPAMIWALYKEGQDKVHIQNYYQPLDELNQDFALSDIYSLISDREVPDFKDEYHVSEWTISIDDLKEWLAKLRSEVQETL